MKLRMFKIMDKIKGRKRMRKTKRRIEMGED